MVSAEGRFHLASRRDTFLLLLRGFGDRSNKNWAV